MKGLANCILILVIFINSSCKQNNQLSPEPIEIDFTKTEVENYNLKNPGFPSTNFKVAISAIISPREGLTYYKDLIEYLEQKTNISYSIIQRKTYQEVNLLLRTNQVNLAFVCSGAYISEKTISDIEILAVPQSNGKTTYKAYIIANKNSSIEKFEDFKGKSFAFTDPLSNTGRLYGLKRLKENGVSENDFFSRTIYSNAHDTSIQLVSKNVIDGATVDGLIFEFIKKNNPKRIENLKVIEKSEEFGIPPIVVPKNLNEGLKAKIKFTFLNIHNDSIGKKILDNLLIDKFVEGFDYNYNSIREMHKIVNK